MTKHILDDYTFIIQGNSVIKVRSDKLKTNLVELYNANPINNEDFKMLGYTDCEDLMETLEGEII